MKIVQVDIHSFEREREKEREKEKKESQDNISNAQGDSRSVDNHLPTGKGSRIILIHQVNSPHSEYITTIMNACRREIREQCRGRILSRILGVMFRAELIAGSGICDGLVVWY